MDQERGAGHTYNVEKHNKGEFVSASEVERWLNLIRRALLVFLVLYLGGEHERDTILDRIATAAFDPTVAEALRRDSSLEYSRSCRMRPVGALKLLGSWFIACTRWAGEKTAKGELQRYPKSATCNSAFSDRWYHPPDAGSQPFRPSFPREPRPPQRLSLGENQATVGNFLWSISAV